MSIRFGWNRPQAGPLTTDDQDVEDVSSPPTDDAPAPEVPGVLTALQHATQNVHDGAVPGAPTEAVVSVWRRS